MSGAWGSICINSFKLHREARGRCYHHDLLPQLGTETLSNSTEVTQQQGQKQTFNTEMKFKFLSPVLCCYYPTRTAATALTVVAASLESFWKEIVAGPLVTMFGLPQPALGLLCANCPKSGCCTVLCEYLPLIP